MTWQAHVHMHVQQIRVGKARNRKVVRNSWLQRSKQAAGHLAGNVRCNFPRDSTYVTKIISPPVADWPISPVANCTSLVAACPLISESPASPYSKQQLSNNCGGSAVRNGRVQPWQFIPQPEATRNRLRDSSAVFRETTCRVVVFVTTLITRSLNTLAF